MSTPFMTGISAAILAGGLGTRLRAAVSDKPKVLAEVNGRPFIAYLLDWLVEANVKRVTLCTGYMSDLVCKILGDRYRGIELCYSVETAPRGTGGALRLALPLLSSTVLVMNGDSFFDLDLARFADEHAASGAQASIALATVSDVARYGAIELSAGNAVASFEEKGSRRGEGLINAGIYLLSRSCVELIPAGVPHSLERDLFPALIGRGLCGFPYSGRFIDIGIPADYYTASTFFSQDVKESSREIP